MWNVVNSFFGDVRPEALAAIAVLLQALILWLLWRILGTQRKTMERQTETAKLIAHALELQTNMFDEQFKFQRRYEAKMERARIFEAVLSLQAKVADLIAEFAPPTQLETFTEEQQRIRHKWVRLEDAISPCLTGLITATHLSPTEKDYCMQFALDVDAVANKRGLSTPQMNINGLRAISQNYTELPKMLEEAIHR